MDYIFNILDNYSKNCKILDKEAIYNIIKILYLVYNVEDSYGINIYRFFRNDKNVSKQLNKCTAACFNEKGITVYLNRLNKLLRHRTTPFLIDNNDITEYEKYLLHNIQILNVINHEFEHLLQDAYLNSYHSDIDKKLMNIEQNYFSFGDLVITVDSLESLEKVVNELIKERHKAYSDNYHLSFTERMTEITAIENTNEYLLNYYDKTKNVIDLNKLFLLCFKMVPYTDKIDNPTKRFFYNIGKEEEFEELDLDDLSQEDRFVYGFNLDEDFYNEQEQIIIDHDLKIVRKF